jgi:hypothetical protein
MDCTKKQLVLPPAGTFDEYLFDGVCAHDSAWKSKNVYFSFVMTSHDRVKQECPGRER